MITPKTKSDVFTSGMEETKVFKIKNSSKGFAILTANLYSNKVGAILRELGCNAIDAHKDSNNEDKSFLVHLPNQLQPEFYIRDFGTGISENDMETVYTVLFESTKENSNDQIGCLGLGSKTPFAYTDNFFVTCFQEGVKKVYNVFMDEMGTPSYSKVFEGDTNEPDGLMVKFAVDSNDLWRFKEEAINIYSYFSKKPEITGQQIEWKEFGNPLMEISGCQLYEKSYYSSRDAKVIMGNIAYPIDGFLSELQTTKSETDGLISQFIQAYNFHLNVPIGTFDIVPSREEISFNAISVKNLRAILTNVIKEFGKEVVKKAQEVTEIDCYLESCNAYRKMVNNLESFHRNIVEKMKLKHKSGAPFIERVELGSDVYEDIKEELEEKNVKQTVRHYFINKPHTSRNLTYRLQVGFNISSVFAGETVFYEVDLKKEKCIARRVKGFLLDPNNDAKHLILIPTEFKKLYMDATNLPESMIEKFDLPNVKIERSSTGSRFEDRVTKDSIRVSSVMANTIDDFEVYSNQVLTRHCENIYYTSGYFSSFPFADFMSDVVGEDEYCIIHIDRDSFIDKIKGWNNTWTDFRELFKEYVESIDKDMVEKYIEHMALKAIGSIGLPKYHKEGTYEFLLNDEATYFHDMVKEAHKNIPAQPSDISDMDFHILQDAHSANFHCYGYGGISGHSLFKFLSDEKSINVIKFYFENAEDIENEKVTLEEYLKEVEGNNRMSLFGTEYSWNETIKKIVERKMKQGVDKTKQGVV